VGETAEKKRAMRKVIARLQRAGVRRVPESALYVKVALVWRVSQT
jgi:hypothetical protein